MGEVRGALRSRDYDEWYRAVRPRLVLSIGGLGGTRDEAEEVADETMVVAWQNWTEVREMDAPQGWAYKTAVNIWQNKRRRKIIERKHRDQPDLASAVSVDEAHVEFRSLIAPLPRREQRILVLRYVMMMTEPDIAATLGLPRGTVAWILHQCHRRLREQLSQRDALPIVAEWALA